MHDETKGALRFGIAGAGPSPGVLPRCERARQGSRGGGHRRPGPGTGERVRQDLGCPTPMAAMRPWPPAPRWRPSMWR